MKLYEIFQHCKSDKIIDEMCKDESFLEEIDWDNRIDDKQKALLKNKVKSMYKKEIENIQNEFYSINKTIDDPILLIIKQVASENRYTLGMFYKKDFEESLTYDINKPEDFKNPLVSILFQKREETLNLTVSPYILDIYPKETIAAAALREMCFFGIDNELREEAVNEAINDIEKSVEDYEKHKDDEDYFYSTDEVREILGLEDTRTEEEKEQEKEKNHREAVKYITDCITAMQKTAKMLMGVKNNGQ